MEVIYFNKLTKASFPNNEIYTIGDFDGVHKGHQKLIKLTEDIAKSLSTGWGVITFVPNTKSFFNSKYRFLNSLEQKLNHFAKLKVPKVIIIDFNQIYALTAAQFVKDYLINYLNVKALAVGSNFKMGNDLVMLNSEVMQKEITEINKSIANNTAANLKSGCEILDINVNKYTYTNKNFKMPIYSMDVNSINTLQVSSSSIKNLLQQGKVQESNMLLGYNFSVISTVIHGNKLGRTLGFPTINMLIPEYVKLRYGIYATKTRLPNGEIKHSVSNFGVRPTIADSNKEEVLETFIFDFNGDLYDKTINIEFIDYIREEKKFANLEELVIGIKNDVKRAKLILTKETNIDYAI